MSEIEETYYVAGRQRDMKLAVAGSVIDECMQCHDAVIIDPAMLMLVKDMKGIICIPCVEEKTGLSLWEILAMNRDHMMKLLRERFGDGK